MSLRIEGHLTSKSSPLAPVSCKLSKQFMVQQHLNAHYKNISNVKSSIDNKCPKSWYKHVNVKDQIKRERLLKSAREHGRDNQSSLIYPNKTYRSQECGDDTNRMYVDAIKPLGPRIYKNDVKSKIAQLRCYNPPKKKIVLAKPNSAPKLIASSYQNTFEEKPPEKMEKFDKFEKSDKLDKLEFTLSQNDEKDLRYLNFCNDVTNDILQNNIFTNRGINQIFDEHIARNKYHLRMDSMLKAYDAIKKELEGKVDMTRNNDINDVGESNRVNYNYHIQPYKPYEMKTEYRDSPRQYFQRSESDLGNRFSYSTDNQVYESYEEKDRNYINPLKQYDLIDDDKSYENISPKLMQHDFSTAPSALQWSLTSAASADEYETNSRTNSQPIQNAPNIDKLCEDIYDIKIKDNQPELIDRNITLATDSSNNELEDNNLNKNVHFAKHNEVYSAPESEDHSLTDVTSMRLEESEDYDENNDSTCVESSLDLNNTFKSNSAKDQINDIKYEDDFDD